MNETQQSTFAVSVHDQLIRKLQPTRFPRMTPLMGAIVGFVLKADFVDPQIAGIFVTSDQFVVAGVEGEAGANHFVGHYADLLRNWLVLLSVAGLTAAERIEAESLFAERIGIFGPTTT